MEKMDQATRTRKNQLNNEIRREAKVQNYLLSDMEKDKKVS